MGNACVTCSSGDSCSGGACARDGGLPTGSACTTTSQCAGGDDPFIPLKNCIQPTQSDGGSSGWTGGYCSGSCFGIFSTPMCPGASDYCNGLNCYQGCSNPGGGQSNCRSGYVCANDKYSDGGTVPNSARCIPNCNNAPSARCGSSSTCLSNGYCSP